MWGRGAHRRRHWRVSIGNGRPSLSTRRLLWGGGEAVGSVRLVEAMMSTLLGPERTTGAGLMGGGCCFGTARHDLVSHTALESRRRVVLCSWGFGGWLWGCGLVVG